MTEDAGVAGAYRRFLGAVGGRLLCRESSGDAILVWTYDGLAIVAVATRRDGDANKLMQWWKDEARFLRGD